MKPEDLKNAQLILSANNAMIPGERFTVKGAGDEIRFIHPRRKTSHTLKVVACESFMIEPESANQSAYPTNCVSMKYMITPELDQEEFFIRDCSDGDGPQPVMIFYSGDEKENWIATSSMYEKPAADIVWWMGFYETSKEDITVSLE